MNALCEALNVPKGTYYNYLNRGKHGNTVYAKRRTEMTPIIEEIYNASNHTYGPGKTAAVMRDRGFHITEHYVADIMHSNGWFSLRPNAKRLYLANMEQKEKTLRRFCFGIVLLLLLRIGQKKAGKPHEIRKQRLQI